MMLQKIFPILLCFFICTQNIFACNILNCSPNHPAVKIKILSNPELVFSAKSEPCHLNNFFADNPARALRDINNTIHLFANNSNGYYQMLGNNLNGPFHADCTPLLTSVNIGSEQDITSYKNYIWIMSTWIDNNGKITALVHNEFHGEKFGTPSGYCKTSQWKLPSCQYWNISGAISIDQGNSFQWIENNDHSAIPFIATPYQYDSDNLNLQGMPSQTNIVQNPLDNNYYLLTNNDAKNNSSGICLFRATNPSDPTKWLAWDGNNFTIAMNQNPYKTIIKNPEICNNLPTLPAKVSVTSITYHKSSQQFILTAETKTWPTPKGVVEAFIYFTSPDLIHWSKPAYLMPIHWWDEWFPNCNTVGEAYPSLLDPASTSNNFDEIESTPYLYYTRLNASKGGCGINYNGNNRDLVRLPLSIS